MARSPTDAPEVKDLEPLRAAYRGDTEAVRAVRSPEKLRNIRDPQTGLTLLHIAVGTNNLELTRFLVEEVRVPFTPDAKGRWPTVIAARCGASEKLNNYIVEKESAYIRSKRGSALMRRLLKGLSERDFSDQGQEDQSGLQKPGNHSLKR